MLISVNGYGFSGSGAVLDLLKEYKELGQFSDVEIPICYIPNGIEDLDYHLNVAVSRYMSSDVAIFDFLRVMKVLFREGSIGQKKYQKNILKHINEYIDAITQIKWQGTWTYHVVNYSTFERFWRISILYRMSVWMHRIFHINIFCGPKPTMYFCVKPSNFDVETKKLMDNILGEIGRKKSTDIFVVNQMFSPDNPLKSFKYFNNPYAINVFRDPRDVYILAKTLVKTHASWIPVDHVEDFVLYYDKIYDKKNRINDSRVLYLQYEDLIYKYDDAVGLIEDFCGIKNHDSKKKYFDPSVSIRYTQMWIDFPQFKSDIEYIEKNLSEYLYDFPYGRKKMNQSGEIIL